MRSSKDFDDIKRENNYLMDSDVNLGNDRESPSPSPPKTQSAQRKSSPISVRKIPKPQKAQASFDLDDSKLDEKSFQKDNQKDSK